MPYITLLGQFTSHGPVVIDSGQVTISINNQPINVFGGLIPVHSVALHVHDEINLQNFMQSFVTINNLPIFLIGDSTACGSVLIPDPQKKKPQQEFIQIS